MAAKNFWKVVKIYIFRQISLKKNKKNRKARFVLKRWVLFQFKVGWLKIKAGTNLESQNYMYLSAPGQFNRSNLFVLFRFL